MARRYPTGLFFESYPKPLCSMNMKLKINKTNIISDLTTPVSLYLKLREKFAEVILLESSDYSSKEDSLSFICCDSLSTISVADGQIVTENHTTSKVHREAISDNVVRAIENFTASFDIEGGGHEYSGVFGYTSFDAVQYFDTIVHNDQKPRYADVPDIRYDFYRYVIVFDHFYERMHVIEHQLIDEESGLDKLVNLIKKQDSTTYQFNKKGTLDQNMTDDQFKEIVTRCKAYCQHGDVFQIVPSRRYSQGYTGDDFNVYRALRSINPSPYLYYFDYGSYKIFGSSPEAHIIVKGTEAEIHPIAGTFKRTGDAITDAELAKKLALDPKENAEHTMLVDLARNDLSKHTSEVSVQKYKEVQYFSHVIHLVSIVKGILKKGISGYQILADTFPAGTLSGAPKYRALELIDDLEPTARGYYGGGIGMIALNGDVNHAIMIRSFFSFNNVLHCQAGAGIVIDSEEHKEMEEVNNKLKALMLALAAAEKL